MIQELLQTWIAPLHHHLLDLLGRLRIDLLKDLDQMIMMMAVASSIVLTICYLALPCGLSGFTLVSEGLQLSSSLALLRSDTLPAYSIDC